MKCNFCGNEVENGRETCAYCGASVVEAKNQPTFVYPNNQQTNGSQTGQAYSNQGTNNASRPVVNSTPQLIWSIVNTICCWPLGIAGVIFAAKSGSAATQEAAEQSLKTAKTLNIIGTSLGVILGILYFVIAGASAFAGF